MISSAVSAVSDREKAPLRERGKDAALNSTGRVDASGVVHFQKNRQNVCHRENWIVEKARLEWIRPKLYDEGRDERNLNEKG